MEVVIITGLSGAGKTKATDWFEDQGYYCIDNMPPALIKNFIELAMTGSQNLEKAAFVVDIRGGNFLANLEKVFSNLSEDENIKLKILFMEASNEVLIRRYNEARRNHPLSDGPVTAEIIEEERGLLSSLRKAATYIIDTSNLKTAETYAELNELFTEGNEKSTFRINIMSFGFKKGIPLEADWVQDVRFIPNPYYVPSLKSLTGNNKKVSQYVLKHDITREYIHRIVEMINRLIPGYIKEGKYNLNIAFGCTGGQHRSVAVANEVYRILQESGKKVTITHREQKQ